MRLGGESNPRIKVLQTSAFPLRHRAGILNNYSKDILLLIISNSYGLGEGEDGALSFPIITNISASFGRLSSGGNSETDTFK